MFANTTLTYSVLTILSIGKKSFTNMGRAIKKSGDTVARLLMPAAQSRAHTQQICQAMFKNCKKLYLPIDDTLIRKFYSELMQGSGFFYDTKTSRMTKAYKLVIALISDGKIAIPIDCAYLFAKELTDLIDHKFLTKDEIAQAFVKTAIMLFPCTKIIVLADGLYATVAFIAWCKSHNINLEVRMHSNRVVEYKGKKVMLKKLTKMLQFWLTGRHMARTVTVLWHGIELEITIVRRIDRHGDETIVFQAATYKAEPRKHVKAYKARWVIEKMIRTTKQHLGLQECYSRSLQKQHNHMMAVLLAYSLAQVEMKKRKLHTPEDAIRRLKSKKANFIAGRFSRLDQILEGVCA